MQTASSIRSIGRALMAGALFAGLSACGALGGGKDKPSTPTVGNRTPILSRIATEVKADPALEGVSVVVPTARRNEDWAQAGGTASNAIGHVELAEQPVRAWTASIPGSNKKRRLAASPVVGNGKLFAVDTDGQVHAFNAENGSRLWTHRIEVDGNMRDVAFGGGVSFNDGRVYATNGAGDVVAINAETGEQIWKTRPAGPLRGAPTVAFNAVYVMTQDNQIHALNMNDGSQLWQEAAATGQSGVFGVAAPAAGQGTVIAGYSQGEVVAYRYENGRTLWSDALARTSISTQVGTLTDVDADPIIDQGRVYALGQGGRMAAYELVTGQRLWELTLAGISTPAVAGEWIFTLTSDARLLAIARETGRVRWVTQLERWGNPDKREKPIFWVGPVLAGNKLWIASSEGVVSSVDLQTGTETPFTKLGDDVSLAPIVANGTLYILDDGGKITAWR
ncbi:outer membrane protein assembly factor BamB [Altererythrobacter atlanticus]|uniref:Outer membrane protein assembly factor BamB n=1 Tax=Croceibacterium atlanticum TaxID=1267766 RepID=A0A0F7KSZ7_9SPHN|nr:PQQ-binding-like beta-propeller repeat protein [Croceibacterium atlanticum]AKH42296.1 Outer membrane protein assembly factor BamB precursor [Croceibacterium atlanticum]MBB5731073.1 outer membrane protein assembly factor BamB [Croceibacterium atlanticum]